MEPPGLPHQADEARAELELRVGGVSRLAALLEELRTVIKLENEAIRDVEGRVRQNESEFFQPKKPSDKKDPPK